MEVLAKKSISIFFVDLLMLIIGIITLPLGVYGLFFVEGGGESYKNAWLLSLPIALIGVGASSLSKYFKHSLSFNLIKLNNDTLIIGKNKYIIKICDLQSVEAEKELGKIGNITLVTNEQKIKLVSVAHYEKVSARLLELKTQIFEPSKSY